MIRAANVERAKEIARAALTEIASRVDALAARPTIGEAAALLGLADDAERAALVAGLDAIAHRARRVRGLVELVCTEAR